MCPSPPDSLLPPPEDLHSTVSLTADGVTHGFCLGYTREFGGESSISCPMLDVMMLRKSDPSNSSMLARFYMYIPAYSGFSDTNWFLASFSHKISSVAYGAITTPPHENELLFEIHQILPNNTNSRAFDITFEGSPVDTPCLHDLKCGTEVSESLYPNTSTSLGSYDPATHVHLFGTRVKYSCGTDRAFNSSSMAGESEKVIFCNWDGTWNSTADDATSCQCKYFLYI